MGSLSVPSGSFEMIVEPSQEDLIRWQPQKLFNRLAILQQSVQLGMDFDIDLAEQTSADDLPDQS